MSNIIPFNENSRLPAHLAKRAHATNNDLTDNVGMGGYPIISIKGKIFTLVKGDEREVISRADPETGEMEPARAIEIVILKANPKISKVWYAAGYTDGSAEKPDCFSNDSERPDPSSEAPQAKTCAACRHNVFGSATNGKGKACSDSRRLAIATPDQLNEPMLLRVPPASLKPLADYARFLDKRGVDYDAVVTRISFDAEEATPKLVLKPRAYLSEDAYTQVQDMKTDDMVEYIISGTGTSHAAAPAPADDDDEIEGAPPPSARRAAPAPEPEPEPAPAPKPRKPRQAPAAKAKPESENPAPTDDDEDLDAGVNLSAPSRKPAAAAAAAADDDEPAAPAKPSKASKAAVVADDSLDDMLAGLGLDD